MVRHRRGWIVWILGWLCGDALANRYGAPLDTAAWHVESSVFECRLTQELPYYGRAVFSHRAGEDVTLSIENLRRQTRTGKAGLALEGAEWQPHRSKQDLGLVAVSEGREAIRLDGSLSRRLLVALYEGMSPVFRSLTEPEPSLQIALSPARFLPAYREYNACLAQLLPVNFEQVSQTVLQFPARQEMLSDALKQQLEPIAVYLKHDNSIQSLLVDAHTDNSLRSADSIMASEKLARAVSDHLASLGIPQQKIVTRWHGERYPVASNTSLKGRLQNRRVTVRLSKEPPPPFTDQPAATTAAQEGTDKTGNAASQENNVGVKENNVGVQEKLSDTPVTDAIQLPSIAPAPENMAAGDAGKH